MVRFYADENFPQPVVEELRRLGHDVRTAQDAGKAGLSIPDDEVLTFASDDDRAVLTLNRKHFIQWHTRRPEHGGIVVCTFDKDFVAQAHRVDATIASQGPLRDQLFRVNRPPR